MPTRIILSRYQTQPLESARAAGERQAETSLDLGLTSSTVELADEGLVFPGGERLDWDSVAAIGRSDNGCFAVQGGEARRIQLFSEQLQRHYSLMPTAGAPTLLIAGFPMHRIKDIDPWADTRAKLRAVAPIRGRVLDTCLGLGYTAVQAAATAAQVLTVELDPTTLAIARLNPWSRALFDSPNIQPVVADAYDLLPALPDQTFDRILHDPPTFSLAGELYSGEFYGHLHRVLKRGGRLFHYIGDLQSKSGHGVARGAVRRLQAAGFERIVRRPEAFGLAAFK